MVKFTIIMMVRTSKPTTSEVLKEAIDCIRNQTHKDYTLLIVENGFDSELKVPELLDNEYLIIAKRRDKYGFELRNTFGIMSDSDYIIHTNGDNHFNSNALELINNEIEKYDKPALVISPIIDRRFFPPILSGNPVRVGNIDLMQGAIRWDVFANNLYTGISDVEDGLHYIRLANKYHNIRYVKEVIGEHK